MTQGYDNAVVQKDDACRHNQIDQSDNSEWVRGRVSLNSPTE